MNGFLRLFSYKMRIKKTFRMILNSQIHAVFRLIVPKPFNIYNNSNNNNNNFYKCRVVPALIHNNQRFILTW